MKKNSKQHKLKLRLNRRLTQGIKKYNLIEDGDHILLGISGGKDSLALAELMAERSKIFKPKFTLSAVHVVMDNISYETDVSYMEGFMSDKEIPFYVRQTSFDASTDKRKSPCFLCSWSRRKELFAAAKELGCNKIALGHHMDDILITLLMNMSFQGSISTMPPLMQMDKFDMQIIRPLCLIEEPDLIELSELQGYKKQIKNCPYEKESYRSEIANLFQSLHKMNPEARYSLWSSMTNIQKEMLPVEVIED